MGVCIELLQNYEELWEFEFNILTYPIAPSPDGEKEKHF